MVVMKQFRSPSSAIVAFLVHSQWEKLKKHSEELNERAETAEYQVGTISQEYRKLFQDKDSELRRLKTENENPEGAAKKVDPPRQLFDAISSQRTGRSVTADGILFWSL